MIKIKSKLDLENLIKNQVQEDLNLEYKSSGALGRDEETKNDISKDISSMANSAGGIVIYGIKEFNERTKRHLPEKIDPINSTDFNREWLENIINSSIKRTINGIEITPIYIDKLKNEVVYIVDIPQSETAHQARDHKYYKRYNFSSIPMEDYEIRDIMNRTKNPIVNLKFKIEKKIYYGSNSFLPTSFYPQEKEEIINLKLYIFQINEGRILASYVNYFVDLPFSIYYDDREDKKTKIIDGIEYVTITGDNTVREVIGMSGSGFNSIPNYGPSRYDPILPGLKSRGEKIDLIETSILEEKYLYWKVFADNANPTSGLIKLNEIEYEELDERGK